jgi:hypothetical protein
LTVAAIETLLFVFADVSFVSFDCNVMYCRVVAVCGNLLAVLGVVLAVRFLFLAGEHALFHRVIAHYQCNISVHPQQTPRPNAGGPATLPQQNMILPQHDQWSHSRGGWQLGNLNANTFKYELRKLLGRATAWITHLLVVAVAVLVVAHAWEKRLL